ncbi:MAG: hypothetical protein Q8L14_38960 [Myxococcales bacterium]|nr:hypothetical protein [Myxococcales bacterium]
MRAFPSGAVFRMALAVVVIEVWSSCTCAQLPDVAFACEGDGGCAQEGFRCQRGLGLCVAAGGGTAAGSAAGGSAAGGSAAGGSAAGGSAAGGSAAGGSATGGGTPVGGGFAIGGGFALGGGSSAGGTAAGGSAAGGSATGGGTAVGGGFPIGGGFPLGGGSSAGGTAAGGTAGGGTAGGGAAVCDQAAFQGIASQTFLPDGGYPGSGQRLNLGGTTTTASSSASGFSPTNVIDSNLNTMWRSQPGCSATANAWCCAPEWVQVAFAPRLINGLVIRGSQVNLLGELLTGRLELLSNNGAVLVSENIVFDDRGRWVYEFPIASSGVAAVRFSPVWAAAAGAGVSEFEFYRP